MFDMSTTRTAGSRVAIITSRISDGKACVLANYRGVGRRLVDSAYEFLKPEEESQNPFLWEAARCSVAAPWFFQTKTLPRFGPLQDGGVRANNPLAIALKESATIWPSHGTPDLLVSVGTGLSIPEYKAQDTPLGSILQDGAVPRIIRAAMSSPSMDGEQGFSEALNYVPDRMRAHIFRLNHALPWPLPRLDDVDRLIDLAESSYSVPDKLVRAILATGFLFLELDEIPIKMQGSFYCEGSILCSSPDAGDLIKRVLLEFPGARFQTGSGYHLGLIANDDECRGYGYYRKKVAFTVNSLEEIISIEIANSSFRHKIGGFLKSM
ncbi:Acyl transferase/acyl hydrolase/lysophospholipase [Penicillium soppii]|uniref:Acyl transferase/acyl hydrolase/lysophospholipase n=1 Tax=Penicillium soppii TaxID=69789 RepID=UPI002546E4CD|nr:Acyl transferase/acyl hydrolase/lysophospholipase [Penicillium soppii]KAJ5865430.1 Acyl transferase/acyl hydrolase/lysophospholipase [Penicillium soppii]